MATMGSPHPFISQILVACLLFGLPVYWLGFMRRPAFLRPLGSVLLLLGTVAVFAAVRSGLGLAVAGAEGAVGLAAAHQEMGERALRIFAGLLVLDVVALAVAWHAGHTGASVLEVESGSLEAVGASTKRFAANTLRLVVALGWALGALHLYDTMRQGRQAAGSAASPSAEAPAVASPQRVVGVAFTSPVVY